MFGVSGAAAVGGVSSVISSTRGTTVGVSDTVGPNVFGVESPGGGGENAAHAVVGRGVRKR